MIRVSLWLALALVTVTVILGTLARIGPPMAGLLNNELTNDQNLLCRATLLVTTDASRRNTRQAMVCIPILEDGTESDRMIPMDLPDRLMNKEARRRLVRGALYVSIEGATSIHDENEMQDTKNATFRVLDAPPPMLQRQLATSLVPTQGNMGLMIVRVTTRDGAAPSPTLQELRTSLLADSGVSLRTQFRACSFGRLLFREARSMGVTLDRELAYYTSPAALADAALAKVLDALGVDSVTAVADKVIFCQPPGGGSWTSVAAVNHWRINMRDTWCLSLSAQMHEMGHTLGLFHSGIGADQYGDTTGLMGYGSRASAWPRSCFNGVKHDQLGWFADRKIVVDPRAGPVRVRLAAFVDYAKTRTEPVLVRVGPYYLQYNRARSFNADTRAKINMVTVTADTASYSDSVAGLPVGGRFEVRNYLASGRRLVIQACRAIPGSASAPDIMVLSIGLRASYCNNTNVPLRSV